MLERELALGELGERHDAARSIGQVEKAHAMVAGEEEDGAHVPRRRDHVVGARLLASDGGLVLRARVPGELAAGPLENRGPRGGPIVPARADCFHQKLEHRGIAEHLVESMLPGDPLEGLGVRDALVREQRADLRVVHRLEMQGLDPAARSNASECVDVGIAQPIGFAAGDPKAGLPEANELPADVIQWRMGAATGGAQLVQPVDEEDAAREVLDPEVFDRSRRPEDAAHLPGLVLEGLRLARSGLAQQDVGALAAEVGERAHTLLVPDRLPDLSRDVEVRNPVQANTPQGERGIP